MSIDQSQLGAYGSPTRGVILAASAVAASCPADTTEDVLAIIPVPANALGPNGQLRISTLWTFTNSVNNKSMRVRFGGIGGVAYLSITQTTQPNMSSLSVIRNRGALNLQVGDSAAFNPAAGVLSTTATGALDTSVIQAVYITGQKATAGETLTLESYLVELFPS